MLLRVISMVRRLSLLDPSLKDNHLEETLLVLLHMRASLGEESLFWSNLIQPFLTLPWIPLQLSADSLDSYAHFNFYRLADLSQFLFILNVHLGEILLFIRYILIIPYHLSKSASFNPTRSSPRSRNWAKQL